MPKLTVGSCFSGIGGLELGLEWTGGFETRWQIENDEYASRVLAKHWPNVRRYTDIRDVSFPERVDVICGGFPCQDVSFAGKRAGLEGKRSTLWSELFRLVCEVKPRWLLAENVPGLLSSDAGRFFGNILRDLASIGFDVEWGVLSAAGVGAPHLRRRVFILAHPMRSGGSPESWIEQGERAEVVDSGGEGKLADAQGVGCEWRKHEEGGSGATQREGMAIKRSGEMANPESKGCLLGRIGVGEEKTHAESIEGSSLQNTQCDGLEEPRFFPISGGEADTTPNSSWWSTEPNVGRVAHGVPSRVDRLRCLGNAVVPQVAQKIGEMILKAQIPAQG